MTVRPAGGRLPRAGLWWGPSLWAPGGDTLSPAEYMYQVMKFNKFSLPPEVGGVGGPHQQAGPPGPAVA